MTTLTVTAIEAMPPVDLVKNFNDLAPSVGMKPVKRFESRTAGIARLSTVVELIAARGTSAAPIDDTPVETNGHAVAPSLIDRIAEGETPIIAETVAEDETAVVNIPAGDVITPPPFVQKALMRKFPEGRRGKTVAKQDAAAKVHGPGHAEAIQKAGLPYSKKGKRHGLPTAVDAIAATTGKVVPSAPVIGKAGKAAQAAREAKEAAPNGGKATIAGRVRELVVSGKSNKEIWAIIQPEFKMSDDKKWFPGWYRWQAKKLGKI